MSDMDSINYIFFEKDSDGLEESEEKCEKHHKNTPVGNGLAFQLISEDKCAVHNSSTIDS